MNLTPTTAPLSRSDRKVLRKEMRPAVLFALLLVLIITAVNLAFHYMDVLTGVAVVERPPVIRLFAIEFLALALGSFVLYFTSKQFLKDLLKGIKQIHSTVVSKKIIRRENGSIVHFLRTSENRLLRVSKIQYEGIEEGQVFNYGYLPSSQLVLDVTVAP